MNNQIKGGAILSYIALFLNIAIAFVYTPFVLKSLGQAEYGLFALVNTTISHFTILDFGFGNAIIRYTAKFNAQNDKIKEQSLHGMFLILYLFIGIITYILGLIITLNIDTIFAKSLAEINIHTAKTLMFLATLNMAISFPFSIFPSIIKAYEKFIFFQWTQVVRVILNPLLMVSVLMLGYRSIGMILVITFLNVLFNLIYIWYCKQNLNIRIRFKGFNIHLLREIFSYSFYIFLAIIVDKLFWSSAQVILGIVSNMSEVAIYAISSNFINIFISLTGIIGSFYLPRFTQMIANQESDKTISDEFIKVSRLQFMICCYIFGGFVLVGKNFTILWVGEQYINSFYIAAIVMASLLMTISQNAGIAVLQAKNLHKFRALAQLSMAVLNVIIAVPLATKWGGIGFALATFIIHFFGIFIVMSLYYQKVAKLDVLGLWKDLGKFFPSLILLIIIFYLANLTIFKSLSLVSNVIVNGVAYTLMYFILIYVFHMKQYEKAEIKKLFQFFLKHISI